MLVVLAVVATVLALSAEGGRAAGPVSSANARWLADTYPRLLDRAADDGGLDYHLATIAAGGSNARHRVAYGLLFSTEGARAEVDRAYDDLLSRPADNAGSEYWTAHLAGHDVLDLRVLLLAADEFHVRAGGTDGAWLDAVYDDVLGRSPDTAGRAYWLGLADAGLPRAALAGAIYQSDEALGRRADAYYLDLLGRSPTTAERAAAADLIRQHGERYLRAWLWASDEAFEPYLEAAWS